jgi:hypothetical protein
MAQLLGLNRLGSDPNKMPADDPAFLPGKTAIKRESALRLWSYIASYGTCGTFLYLDAVEPERRYARMHERRDRHAERTFGCADSMRDSMISRAACS